MFLVLGDGAKMDRLPWRVVDRLVDAGLRYCGDVAWVKGPRMHESVYVLCRELSPFGRTLDVWEIPAAKRLLEFPVELPMSCMRMTGVKKGSVLDPFAGYGSTGMAAKALGWDFLGFEKLKATCDAANRRMQSDPSGQGFFE